MTFSGLVGASARAGSLGGTVYQPAGVQPCGVPTNVERYWLAVFD